MKAIWKGVVLAESNGTIVVEGNHYFPASAVNMKYLQASETKTTCAWKGTAHYYSIDVETQAAMLKTNLPSDSQLWADFATRTDRESHTDTEDQKDSQEIDMRVAQQVRMRLANVMARRLDIFQNRTQYLWARGNQIASIVTGALLTAYALTRESTPSRVEDYVALFCLSLLAGMLAPFAKDVVSAVSGIR